MILYEFFLGQAPVVNDSIGAASASYTLTGTPATLYHGYKLTATPAAVVLAGQDATLTYHSSVVSLIATAAGFTLGGLPLNFIVTRINQDKGGGGIGSGGGRLSTKSSPLPWLLDKKRFSKFALGEDEQEELALMEEDEELALLVAALGD